MLAHSQRNTGTPSRDPFCISAGDLSVQAIRSFKLNLSGDYGYAGGLEGSIGIFGQRNRVNQAQALKEFWWRFGSAMFVAMTMIGPMLLMVLHKGVATDLATTSVAVVLVSGILAWLAHAGPETVVGIVAAYTAVLVVFVGTLQT
jgi:hypothetical protein